MFPLLMAWNGSTLPEPLFAPPMKVLSLVQLYVVPDTVPVKVTCVVLARLHTCWLAGDAVTVGLGYTVSVLQFAANWLPGQVGLPAAVTNTAKV